MNSFIEKFEEVLYDEFINDLDNVEPFKSIIYKIKDRNEEFKKRCLEHNIIEEKTLIKMVDSNYIKYIKSLLKININEFIEHKVKPDNKNNIADIEESMKKPIKIGVISSDKLIQYIQSDLIKQEINKKYFNHLTNELNSVKGDCNIDEFYEYILSLISDELTFHNETIDLSIGYFSVIDILNHINDNYKRTINNIYKMDTTTDQIKLKAMKNDCYLFLLPFDELFREYLNDCLNLYFII